MWYAMRIGLTYNEALDISLGELRTLIAIEQIKTEGAKEKIALTDEDIIPDVR